jgi:hypothetical protein
MPDSTKFSGNWQFGLEVFMNLIYNQNRTSIGDKEEKCQRA